LVAEHGIKTETDVFSTDPSLQRGADGSDRARIGGVQAEAHLVFTALSGDMDRKAFGVASDATVSGPLCLPGLHIEDEPHGRSIPLGSAHRRATARAVRGRVAVRLLGLQLADNHELRRCWISTSSSRSISVTPMMVVSRVVRGTQRSPANDAT
jgi:hypothetical protein